MFNKVLDILMSSNIKVREGVNEDFAGSYPKEMRKSFDKKILRLNRKLRKISS